MSGTILKTYRLPVGRPAAVGRIRVILDRKDRYHVDSTNVSSIERSGDFTILSLVDGRVYYVLTSDFEKVRKNR